MDNVFSKETGTNELQFYLAQQHACFLPKLLYFKHSQNLLKPVLLALENFIFDNSFIDLKLGFPTSSLQHKTQEKVNKNILKCTSTIQNEHYFRIVFYKLQNILIDKYQSRLLGYEQVQQLFRNFLKDVNTESIIQDLMEICAFVEGHNVYLYGSSIILVIQDNKLYCKFIDFQQNSTTDIQSPYVQQGIQNIITLIKTSLLD